MKASNACCAEASEFVAHSGWPRPETGTGSPEPILGTDSNAVGALDESLAPPVELGLAKIVAMIGELLQERRPLSVVLDAMCRLFDATVEGCISSVLLADHTRTPVRRAPGSESPRVGTLASSPIFALTGELVGTFVIYGRAARSLKPCAAALLQQFSIMAGIAIERIRTEEALDKVRAELAHVTRASSLGALTASIAHEVNQPLSGIVTNASACLRMLAADPPDLEGARETARRTIRDGQRAAHVIARLRTLFRKKTAPMEPVDLNEATEEVTALMSSELQRTGVILRAQLAEDLPSVSGDRVQLQQVILNLLRNASEAMEDIDDRPRHLTIRTEKDLEGGVRLSVRDVGIGLPADSERLFQAFYSTKSSGMGIGLSVSHSIIENHRGRLWAESNSGPGATFSFRIPRAPGSERDTQRAGVSILAANAGGAVMSNS